MDTGKPKSIKTIGLVVTIISAFIVVSNSLGALVASLIGFSDEVDTSGGLDSFSFIISYYIEVCLFMIIIGLFYLLSGMFIQRYKLWANRFATLISIIQIIFVWIVMFVLASSVANEADMQLFKFGAIVTAIFWTIPFGFFIWFLNKKGIKEYFS